MNKKTLLNVMGYKTFFLILILLTFIGCDYTDYQILELNNKERIIKVYNASYIIDSVAFENNNDIIYSVSLKNKSVGTDKFDLSNPSSNYKIYINKMKHLDCKVIKGIVFIRKKGFKKNITYAVQRQKKYYEEIQQFWINYYPCSDSITKIKALRRLK